MTTEDHPNRHRLSPKAKEMAEGVSAASTERGATRLDDQANEAAMELRKREGYF